APRRQHGLDRRGGLLPQAQEPAQAAGEGSPDRPPAFGDREGGRLPDARFRSGSGVTEVLSLVQDAASVPNLLSIAAEPSLCGECPSSPPCRNLSENPWGSVVY